MRCRTSGGIWPFMAISTQIAPTGSFGQPLALSWAQARHELVAYLDDDDVWLPEKLEIEVARMENLTTRLSDNYLDLDLLDQQARDVLGMIRADEIVIR